MDDRRKRALFRANHRGMKETDILIGRFAQTHMADLTEDEMVAFEALLEAQDIDVLNWVGGKVDVPPEYDTPLFQRLKAFKPKPPQ